MRTRGKSDKFSAAFLKVRTSQRIVPKYIVARIERSRARHISEMEGAFLTDDVEKLTSNQENYEQFTNHIG